MIQKKSLIYFVLMSLFGLGSFCFGVILGKSLSDHMYERQISLMKKKATLAQKKLKFKKRASVEMSERLIENKKNEIKNLAKPRFDFENKEKIKKQRSQSQKKDLKSYLKSFYSFQIASFRKQKQAQRQVLIYTQQGFTSFYKTVKIQNTTWYRVFLGNFNKRSDAFDFKRKNEYKIKLLENAILKRIN